MKTISEAFLEFLKEQKEDLSPRTYNDYEKLISLFECKVGWTISLLVAKTGKVWRILESGYMLPP